MTTKIFSDRALFECSSFGISLLAPFWGLRDEDPRSPFSGRFARYVERGGELFELVDLSQADFAVLPFDWTAAVKDPKMMVAARHFIREARTAGRQTLVFISSDLDDPVNEPDVIVLRCSMYASRRSPAEHAQPAWSEDFVERYLAGRVVVREWSERPTVGFCGLAPGAVATTGDVLSWYRLRIRAAVRSLALRMGLISRSDGSIRSAALRRLKADRRLTTNFKIRHDFMAGAYDDGVIDFDRLAAARREYVANIVSSDYVLCARGVGNFSFRLYEVLCSGRIPVFINTDCVLPFEDVIPWREICVWVEARDIDEIGDRVLDFHRAARGDRFVALQHACRSHWERYLSPLGFFSNLHLYFGR